MKSIDDSPSMMNNSSLNSITTSRTSRRSVSFCDHTVFDSSPVSSPMSERFSFLDNDGKSRQKARKRRNRDYKLLIAKQDGAKTAREILCQEFNNVCFNSLIRNVDEHADGRGPGKVGQVLKSDHAKSKSARRSTHDMSTTMSSPRSSPLGRDDNRGGRQFDFLTPLESSIKSNDKTDLSSLSFGTPSYLLSNDHSQIPLIMFTRKCKKLCLPPIKMGSYLQRADDLESTFDFSDWGLNNDYIETLCQSHHRQLRHLTHINLSHNRLTNNVFASLVPLAVRQLLSLDLSYNVLSRSSSLTTLCHAFCQHKAPLCILKLNGCKLHDTGACQVISSIKAACKDLIHLELMDNDLGRINNTGILIGQLITSLRKIRIMNLRWNHFSGDGAVNIFNGLHENGEYGGRLSEMDISFNSLGSRCPEETSKAMAAVLRDSDVLFHLDISHNHLSSSCCMMIADGLRNNHSLFGIHITGNEATVDAFGFVVPTKMSNNNDDENIITRDRNQALWEEVPSTIIYLSPFSLLLSSLCSSLLSSLT